MHANVVILEVAWGAGAPWFRINPRNFTGSRLYTLFGTIPFVVTNACPQIVSAPNRRGTPDPGKLRIVLKKLAPRFVLVCGAIAQRTFTADMVSTDCVLMYERHPAARTWTKAELIATRDAIRARTIQIR